MTDITQLHALLQKHFADSVCHLRFDELTLDVKAQNLTAVSEKLRDNTDLRFDMLVDLCGVDYLHYGLSEWETNDATAKGFERGVDRAAMQQAVCPHNRFAVVLHLLSTVCNHRLRVRVFLDEASPTVDSVTHIWPSAAWFEREAFDLFGIMFTGHPDLRRILTDYGFVGHPFRKDFPVSGHVEARYDGARQKVVYEPVSITPRVLEPKVIRKTPAVGDPA